MKVAEINMVHFGSTGKIMLWIADCVRSNGEEARTYSPTPYLRHVKTGTVEIESHSYFGSRFENKLHRALYKFTGIIGIFSFFGTRRLIKMLDEYAPDIIHLHNLQNSTICISALFRYIKKKKIKTVWTLHDCWSFTGICSHFTMAGCDRWKTGCCKCSQYRTDPLVYVDNSKKMYKLKKKWFTGIEDMTLVTPSRWLADLTRESFLKDYPVRVINNGIDISIFKPTDSDFRKKYGCEDKFILLGVAFGWGKRKGLDIFIEMSKRLDDRYKIVLVGTNDTIDRELPDNIISIHRTNDQRELAEIYSAADLLVNPTREDNYPTVNLESIACGTPVITFRTGGSPECIDEKTGMVVDCDDIDGLIEGIEYVYKNRPFSKEDCLAKAEEFDMNVKFKEYLELFREV